MKTFLSKNETLAVLAILLMAVFALCFHASKRPCPQIYTNWDEVIYNSVAISLLRSGQYKMYCSPHGLIPTESFFAGNSILYPYFSYLSFKCFGISRLAMRLPSLLAYLGSGILLLLCIKKLRLSAVHSICVMGAFLMSPLIIYSACIGRAEMLCGFAVYISSVLCVISNDIKNKYQAVCIFVGGMASAFAVWNHPLFLVAALLPVLLAEDVKIQLKNNGFRLPCFFFLGSSATFLLLSLFLVIPHWDSWHEQFLANASNTSSFTDAYQHGYVKQVDFITLFKSMKARFSTFGVAYLAWYASIPIFGFFILSPTRKFLFGFLLLFSWMMVIEWKTSTMISYAVQFSVGVPVLLLLCKSRVKVFCHEFSTALLVAISFFSIIHTVNVLKPSQASEEYTHCEEILKSEIAALPPGVSIYGPVEAALPSWRSGSRYFLPLPPPIGKTLGLEERYRQLVKEQANFVILDDLKISQKPNFPKTWPVRFW